MRPSAEAAAAPRPSLVSLSAAWFGFAYLWNGLHAIVLPALIAELAPGELKATYLGALTFAGLLLAMFTQPIAGAWSDRSGWLGRYGKRRPWLALGLAVDVGILAALAGAHSLALIALLYAGLQISSSTAEAALQGMLPDQAPAGDRGRASGYKNAAQIAGFVAGVGVGGFWASRGHPRLALLAAAVVLIVSWGWTLRGVREQPTPQRPGAGRAALRSLRTTFDIDHTLAPGFRRFLAGRALLMAGYFTLQGFAQYFIADRLRLPNPAGVTALLMGVMGAATLLLAIPTGVLADRIGRRPPTVAAGLLGAAMTLALLLVTQVWQLALVGGLVGASAGIFMSVNWAWAADLAPPDEAARYLGLSNVAAAGASALGRLLAGPIIDRGNALWPGRGYDLLFMMLAASMLAGAWIFWRIAEAAPSSRLVEVEIP